MVSLLRGFLFLLVAIGMLACSDGETPPAELTFVQAIMQDPAELARGEALFLGTCAGFCHSPSPEDTGASYLFDCAWDYGGSDDEIFAVISDGIPDTRMVGFGENFPGGEEDKWRIIAYLRANQQSCE